MNTYDANQARFQRFIDDAIAANPIEADLLKRIIASLESAGDPIVKIDDREEVSEVSTPREIFEAAFNLDELFLITKSGSWVRLTMGEEWDMICDYTTDLEDALKPVNEFVESNC